MSKKYILFFLFSFFFSVVQGQNFQLLYQPFEFNGPTDTLGAGLSSNTGVNKWRMDNKYDGLGIYPNTVRQDSTYLGQINGAPFSRYLHIYDSGNGASQGITNCSYDPAMASDHFAIVDSHGVCTIGFDTVYFSFFYTCMGDTNNAYGQVYYSRNSGPWTLAAPDHYSNKSKWKYEFLTNPAWANATNLRFGFRWVNNGSAAPVTTAMGVDDVQIVAHFDSITGADTITAVVSPLTVCAGQYLYFNYQLSDSICDGVYEVQLSDGSGNFANYEVIYSVQINYPSTSFAGPGLQYQVPTSTFPGSCYRIRWVRYIPGPGQGSPLVVIESPCINITLCPNTVTTLQPVVTMDTNAVCAGSVIDVPFYSTGVFLGNDYIAQLSDINGSFANPTILGTKHSDVTYDPLFPDPNNPPPGMVSGLIPDTVSPGCNYYIRIIATFPIPGPGPTLGTQWGPFCIQHCDIITNHEQDVCVCLYTDTTQCIPIHVNTNFYDSSAVYQPPNQFVIQIITMGPGFAYVGTLGNITAVNDTTIQMCLTPSVLQAAGVSTPGSYYLRVVATNSSAGADSSFGSLIRFIVYAPSFIPLPIFAQTYPAGIPILGNGSAICLNDLVLFYTFIPPGASVRWKVGATYFNQNALLLIFNIPGNFTVQVQVVYGSAASGCFCVGPLSPAMTFTVLGPPKVFPLGPSTICVGDTMKYQTGPQDSTFLLWSVTPGGTITDTSNTAAWITFSTPGQHTISIYGLNRCSQADSFRVINVLPPPVAQASGDTTVCTGSPVTLSTSPPGSGWTYKWTTGATQLGTNDSLTVSPTSTTTYVVSVTNPILIPPVPIHQSPNCVRTDTVTITVDQPPQSSFTDSVCVDGTPIVLNPGITASHSWSTGVTADSITVINAGTYTDTLQVTGETCYRVYTYTVGLAYPDSSEQNSFICTGDPLVLDATESGATSYQWNTGQTSSQISIDSVGTYSVVITSSLRRCSITKTYHAMEVPDSCDRDFTLPNVFTPNGDGPNDTFHGLTFGTYHTFLIKIFNRWGELVFESTDQYFEWDGTNKQGKECTEGVYYYVGNIAHPQDSRALHGFVTLIRNNK